MRGIHVDESLQCVLQAKAVKAREKAVVDTARDDDEEVLRKREERDAAKKKEEKVNIAFEASMSCDLPPVSVTVELYQA